MNTSVPSTSVIILIANLIFTCPVHNWISHDSYVFSLLDSDSVQVLATLSHVVKNVLSHFQADFSVLVCTSVQIHVPFLLFLSLMLAGGPHVCTLQGEHQIRQLFLTSSPHTLPTSLLVGAPPHSLLPGPFEPEIPVHG